MCEYYVNARKEYHKRLTRENVKKFLELLPADIEKPVEKPEPEGQTLLEWYKRDNDYNIKVYSIVFNHEKMVFTLYDKDRTRNYGSLGFCEENIQKLFLDLKKHFKIMEEIEK